MTGQSGLADMPARQHRRRIVFRLWLILGCVLFLPACKGNAALGALNILTPNSGYSLTGDVPYGSESRQTMDIYRPDRVGEHSRIIVFVYGGAWRKGVKEDYAFLAHALASEGHWLVVPDYRLYPEVSFPAIVEDIALAIKAIPAALPAVTADIQGDMPITLMGHSSGAHSAALIAADPSWLEDAAVKVTDLITMSGPYDLPLDHPEVRRVFSGATDSSRALPIENVTREHPPVLLIHGDNDNRVLPLHTRRYADALSRNAVNVELLWLEDGGHASPLTGLSRLLPDNGAREAVLNFLNRPR